MGDFSSHHDIRDHLLKIGNRHWSAIEVDAREYARDLFTKNNAFNSHHDAFCEHVNRWHSLKDDPVLLKLLLNAMRKHDFDFNSAIHRLHMMQGDEYAARSVFTLIKQCDSRFREWGELAQLMAHWAGGTPWGNLQFLLWRQPVAEESVGSIEITTTEREVCILLHQFGIPFVGKASFHLANLSAEANASWRRRLKAAVAREPELRLPTAETLLWLAPSELDRPALFAVLDLYDGESTLDNLRSLLNHPDPLVQLRAGSVLDIIAGEPDTMDLLLSSRGASSRGIVEPPAAAPARTWIADARIEQLIERTLNTEASRVGATIGDSLDMGEESLLMHLLDRLTTAFDKIDSQLLALAAETHTNERLSLRLVHRVVGKHEEGGPGVEADKFSADVCFVFEARDAGKRFARRASLVQAKRLFRQPSGKRREYYPIKASQLADLTQQTLASFLLLLGPVRDEVQIPVIPAGLALDLIEREQLKSQLSPSHAALLGKRIGSWLLEDVIGLWTGDWNPAIIQRSEGGPGTKPFIMVEIIAERQRKGPDGWRI